MAANLEELTRATAKLAIDTAESLDTLTDACKKMNNVMRMLNARIDLVFNEVQRMKGGDDVVH